MVCSGAKIKKITLNETMTSSTIIQKVLDLIPFKIRNLVKNIPIAKQIQAFIMIRYMNGKEFNSAITGGPAKGLVFPVKLPQDKQMWIGTWELNFAEALKKSVKPGWVCYDIGGYKGYYAGVMALKGASEVYVFEPMPTNAKKIEQLIDLNSSLPIILKQFAVSDYVGEAIFKIMPDETMGKLETSSFQQSDNELEHFSVKCLTLDELMKNGLKIPDFIKIDVEGAEEIVLKGGVELLQKKAPLLMIEIHSPEIGKRCLAILKKFYSSVIVFETGKVPQHGDPEICHYIASN